MCVCVCPVAQSVDRMAHGSPGTKPPRGPCRRRRRALDLVCTLRSAACNRVRTRNFPPAAHRPPHAGGAACSTDPAFGAVPRLNEWQIDSLFVTKMLAMALLLHSGTGACSAGGGAKRLGSTGLGRVLGPSRLQRRASSLLQGPVSLLTSFIYACFVPMGGGMPYH